MAGERRLNTTLDGGLQEVHVSCPNQGSIWIEPKKNYARDASCIQRLTYTVLPEGIDLHVVEPCSALGEPCAPAGPFTVWVGVSAHLFATEGRHGPLDDTGGRKAFGGEPIFRCIQIFGFTACPSRRDPLSCTSSQRENCLAGRRVGRPSVSYRRPPECPMPHFSQDDNTSILVSELGELNRSGLK